MNHGMSNKKFAQCDLVMQRRQNLDANGELVCMQERRLTGTFGAAHGYVVEMRSQSRKIKIEPANLSVASGGEISLLHNLAQRELLEVVAAKIEVSAHDHDDEQSQESSQRPADRFFPILFPIPIHDSLLKSLPDRDVVLQWIDPGHGIQIAPNVKAHWTNRGRVTQSHSDRVAVVVDEVMDVDRAIDIASVVKDHAAERLCNSQGKARFGIQNEKLSSAHGHGDVHTSRLALHHSAERNQVLRTGLVNGKSA